VYRYFFIYTFIQGRIYLIYVLGLLKQTKTSSTYDIEQSEGTTRKYSSYSRFDLSEIDYDVCCFIDKGSDGLAMLLQSMIFIIICVVNNVKSHYYIKGI
jgi:hypothetical protein